MSDDELHFFTVAEVSKMLAQKPATTRLWLKTGRIKGVKLNGEHSDWRISKAEVQRLVNQAYGSPE